VRPLEYGPARPLPGYHDDEFDLTAKDFLDLAEQLGV
jgi:2-haloacid dehalogenase